MPNSDFNGDGRDDILWRHDHGWIGTWSGQAEGGFVVNQPLYFVPLEWQIAGTGDFNGDGRDDILWRHDSGTVGYWYGQAGATFIVNPILANPTNAWGIVDTGDFNGDGRDDILWRHADGRIGAWFGQQDGSFASGIEIAVPLTWQAVGAGDFDGDGLADILWWDGDRLGTWSGRSNGSFQVNAELTPNAEGVSAIGDFNGDGLDDFASIDGWGFHVAYLARANHTFSDYEGAIYIGTHSWNHILVATNDYNGDGTDDTLFREHDGRVTSGDYSASVPADWHVSPDYPFIF